MLNLYIIQSILPKLYAGFKPVLNKTILLFHFFAFFFFLCGLKKKEKPSF